MRLLSAVSAASVVVATALLVAVGVSWRTSRTTLHLLALKRPNGTCWFVATYPGGVSFGTETWVPTGDTILPATEQLRESGICHRSFDPLLEFAAGSNYSPVGGGYVPPWAGKADRWLRPGHTLLGFGWTTGPLRLYAPFWSLDLPPAATMAAVALRWSKARSRFRTGRCPACGYDLRATPGRSPECGRTATV